MAGFTLSGKARQDLQDIGAYIARDNPISAGRFVENLERRLEILEEHPLAGRSRSELAAGLRSIAFGRYIVFYLVLEGHVEIARVIHGSRDLRRALTER